MSEQLEVRIRPLAREELDFVERHLSNGPPDKHRRRLAQQAQSEVVYLVAWRNKVPIGHCLLKWGGSSDEPMASTLESFPDVEDLFVAPDCRSLGVGSQLLEIAEQLARRAGYTRIGLGVGIDNSSARELYESRGYQYTGLGEYVIGGRYADRQGRERIWKETCIYLIKSLSY